MRTDPLLNCTFLPYALALTISFQTLSDDGGVLYAATEKGGVFSLDPSRSEARRF